MALKTITELENHLLAVMDCATDSPSKVNPQFTKEQTWNMYMGICISKREGPLNEAISDNVLRDFPEYLIDG